MPHQLFDRDYFGAFFQQIRGEGVTQRVTAGFDARSLCVSFHKFRERGLSAYSRQWNFASPSPRGDPLSKFYVI